jgi:HTH-type transcriptional regulator, sugar sensing transcriptional regulator
MIEKTLSELGLNDKEVTIYLALLPLSGAPASVLAKKTGITRSTAQYTCQQLVKKGLCRSIERNNSFIYSTEHPERLAYLLEQQKKEIRHKKGQVQRIIEDLNKMINPQAALPEVKYYEGKEGILELFENILRLNAPTISFEDKGNLAEQLPELVPQIVKQRIKKGIPNKCICPGSNTVNTNDPKELRETRYVDVEKYPFTCDITVCKDELSIASIEEHFAIGIVVKHKQIADNFKHLFQYVWDSLENNNDQRNPKKSGAKR